MASRGTNGYHSKRDQLHAAWSYREIKQQHEEYLKESRIRKRLQRIHRSNLRRKQAQVIRRQQQIQRRWLFIQRQIAVKKALLQSVPHLYILELEFQERRLTIRRQKQLFTSRLDQASVEELWVFYRCGRKLPYLDFDEANAHRTGFGRPDLSIYLCWERSPVVEGPHYHLGNPPENSRWTAEKLLIIDEIRKRETEQAV